MSLPDGKHLSFPFRIGPDGRTATVASRDEHVRDELIQLVLTNLGERLFLPEFGGGARRLVFENINEPTQAMAKALLTEAIGRWLGQRLELQELAVEVHEETIEIQIKYQLAGAEETRALRFQTRGS